MSKHLNENTRKKSERSQKGLLDYVRLYPDGGLDGEGYRFGSRMVLFLVPGALLLAASQFFPSGDIVRTVLCLISFIISGFCCFRNLLYNLRHGRYVSEALLVTLAGLIAFPAGIPGAGAAVMLFYQCVKFVEVNAVHRQQEKAQILLRMLPDSATVLDGGTAVKIKPVHIREGDLLLVEPGEIIPTDGIVEEGMSSLDLEPLISAKKIVPVAEGSTVLGGCRNLSVPLKIRASCDYASSTASKTYSSFNSVIRGDTEDQRLAVKAGNILVPVMLCFFVIFGLLVPVFSGNWTRGLKTGMVCLLAACPFALTGALSLSVFSAVTEIFAGGIVIRDIRVLNRLARLETFICNKTGTITESVYTVKEVVPEGISEERFLTVLAKVESQSDHPIAKAIRRYAGVSDDLIIPGMKLEEIPCLGVIATIAENTVYVGNAALLFEHGINCAVPEGQGTAIHAAINDTYCGYILLENQMRENNFEAIEQMRSCGVKNFALLSGDLRSIVRQVASSLNFNVVKAELTPEGKLAAVDYLAGNKTQGRTVACAGDGANELATAVHADISVTTGALGDTEASRADAAVLGEGIAKFPTAVRASRASGRISFVSVAAHYALRIVLVVLSLAGVCPPVLAGGIFALASVLSYLFSSVFFDRV